MKAEDGTEEYAQEEVNEEDVQEDGAVLVNGYEYSEHDGEDHVAHDV